MVLKFKARPREAKQFSQGHRVRREAEFTSSAPSAGPRPRIPLPGLGPLPVAHSPLPHHRGLALTSGRSQAASAGCPAPNPAFLDEYGNALKEGRKVVSQPGLGTRPGPAQTEIPGISPAGPSPLPHPTQVADPWVYYSPFCAPSTSVHRSPSEQWAQNQQLGLEDSAACVRAGSVGKEPWWQERPPGGAMSLAPGQPVGGRHLLSGRPGGCPEGPR